MPRNHATTKVDTLGRLDSAPVRAVGEYLASKIYNELFLKPPNFYSPGDQLESTYIVTKLEHESYQKHLEDLQENLRLQNIISLQRAKKTVKDQDQLRERLVIVNRILRDMGEKKKIAYRKIYKEMAIQKELNDEIAIKAKRYHELKVFRKTIKETTAEYRIYESVLSDAAKKSNLLSIRPLINICDAIMVAQGDITDLNDEKIRAIEGMRKRILDIVKQAELIYSGLINELALMNRSYNTFQNECLKWERIMWTANKSIIERKTKNELARDGISQMYRMLCFRRCIPPTLVRKDVDKTLNFIMEEVDILKEVVAECKKLKL